MFGLWTLVLSTREQCAQVVVKNKRNALFNPFAGHGSDLTRDYVMDSPMVSYPLSELDISPFADGAVVKPAMHDKDLDSILGGPTTTDEDFSLPPGGDQERATSSVLEAARESGPVMTTPSPSSTPSWA